MPISDVFAQSAEQERNDTSGMAVAIVMDNKVDSQGRIEVKLPKSSDDEIGLSARIATPMAGAGYGMFCVPENKDEVLIAFDKQGKAYVLGALWNGVDKSPDTNADGKNNLRFIKSRSGHLIRLDDTENAEKIEIIDKSGENSITIDTASNTITIKSAKKDITIEAKQGTIKLDAQSIEISSSKETKVQATGGLTLDGKSGNTTIKGATVNIN